MSLSPSVPAADWLAQHVPDDLQHFAFCEKEEIKTLADLSTLEREDLILLQVPTGPRNRFLKKIRAALASPDAPGVTPYAASHALSADQVNQLLEEELGRRSLERKKMHQSKRREDVLSQATSFLHQHQRSHHSAQSDTPTLPSTDYNKPFSVYEPSSQSMIHLPMLSPQYRGKSSTYNVLVTHTPRKIETDIVREAQFCPRSPLACVRSVSYVYVRSYRCGWLCSLCICQACVWSGLFYVLVSIY